VKSTDRSRAVWARDHFLLVMDGRQVFRVNTVPLGYPTGAAGLAPPQPSRSASYAFGEDWPLNRTLVRRPFPGQFLSIASGATQGVALLPLILGERFHPAVDPLNAAGAIRLRVKLPANRPPGVAEPLLVTGISGLGDVVYLIYGKDLTVRVAHDHWGWKPLLSEPMALDPAVEHVFEISLGSLYPAGDGRFARKSNDGIRRIGQIFVAADGHPLLTGEREFYVSEPKDVCAGANVIEASSCIPEFTGEILEASLVDPLTELPAAAQLAAGH
jgi:hypothetical protein